MDKKIGEPFHSLPTDPTQEIASHSIELLTELFGENKLSKPSKPNPKKVIIVSDSDSSDSESESESESQSGDEEDEEDDEEEDTPKKKDTNVSMWSEIKTTFLASILFVLLNTQLVDTSIRSIGMDGFKLICIKLFLFAIIFFILRYKLL